MHIQSWEISLLQARWMAPTASAHVTLQGAASGNCRPADSQKAAGIPEAPAVDDGGFSAAQQAYMPFSTGPRRCRHSA